MHYALDVAQAAVLRHSLLLRDGARHGEALLDALLREGGRGAHEHDGRLVRQHLRVQLGEELVLLEGPRRLHLAARVRRRRRIHDWQPSVDGTKSFLYVYTPTPFDCR